MVKLDILTQSQVQTVINLISTKRKTATIKLSDKIAKELDQNTAQLQS